MIDKEKVREVILFAENDSYLHMQLVKNYLPNLQKKVISGKYDKELAVKLLQYYYSNYVRPYMIKPSIYGWDSKLNPSERKEFGKYFVECLWDDYGLKELSKAPKGTGKKGKNAKK